MVIATGMTTNMKTQEQMTETFQDDTIQKASSQLIENGKKKQETSLL